MCRVKHGEQFVISTKDSNDKELEDMSFENLDEMAEQMEILAKTDDEKIRYVDVYMPVPLLQVYILNTFDNLFIKTKLCFAFVYESQTNQISSIYINNDVNCAWLWHKRVLHKYTSLTKPS